MAELEQQTEGLDTEDKSKETADQFAEADKQADPVVEVMPLEEIASKLGWVPEDKYEGPKEKWKPADKFIIDGKKIQERQARDLKGIRETLENIKLTSGAIMADKLREQREELARKYESAVDQGDRVEAAATLRQFDAVDAALAKSSTAPVAAPAPETEQWVQKNGRVMSDPLAAQRALQVCDAYARAGQTVEQQLANTEAVMKREFPHLFDDKGPASVSAPTSRSSATAAKGANTAANLPKEAKDHAKDLVERGMIPDVDAYAKHYFEELEKRK